MLNLHAMSRLRDINQAILHRDMPHEIGDLSCLGGQDGGAVAARMALIKNSTVRY